MTDTRDNLWGEAGLDEEVEVDHRALIDKILARYAGEFTVFRELLQNSDDASAKTVEIHFQTREHLDKLYNRTHTSETSATIPDLQTRVFVQWMFRHDGNLFTDADWNRLSKIAEGNPDEEKIGAFGVGFYSVFSVTDEPLVRSGKQWMGFYWKDSQLVARVGEIPSSMENEIAPSGSPWSIFDIFLREEAPFSGNYLEFTRFLATSLTFVQHIVQVSVFIDDHQVAHIQKEMDQPKQMTVPPYFNRTTPLGMMDLKGVHTNEFHITARVMRWIHQSKKAKQSSVDPQRESTELQASESMETGPLDNVVSSIVLTIYSAQVSVRPEKSLSDELFRATKKKLPETCACSLIYIEKDDTTDKENSVFRGLQADLDAQGTGRIFIGHATSQSTGMGGHVSARFIPTVERESVDLVDQHVSKWNKELLYIIGLLGRFVYDMEISRVRDSWDQATKDVGPANRISEVIATQLDARGNRLLQFFSFYPTTPSRLVGKEIEAAFFSCAPDQAFLIMSTTGVQPARQVLFHDKIIKGFTKSLSMISCSAEQEPSAIVKHLRARGMLQDVTVQDVLDGLSKHLLQTEELVECLKWRIKIAEQISSHDKELIHQRFLQNTTFYLSKDGIMGGDELKLSSIKTFVTPSNRIPWNCPFPPHTLPFLISSNFQPSKLRSVFGWNELCIADWATYLVAPSTQNSSEKTVTTSATFAEEILNIIATTWATLPEGEKVQLKTILKEKTVVPTTSGMMKPEESYLPSVDLFEDLPIVSLPSGALDDDLSNLLSFLGVKKHVEINLIFHRKVDTGIWDTWELLDFIARHKGRLPPAEIQSLRQKAAFSQRRTCAVSSQHQKKTLSELYQPLDVFLELGLPVLEWKANSWDENSEKAKLLFSLGLKSHPELRAILEFMAHPDEKIRTVAMDYFLGHFSEFYAAKYDHKDFADLAYVPAVRPGGTVHMSKPSDVYADPECAVMGFSVVKTELREVALSKLRIRDHPSTQSILNVLLETPPSTPQIAQSYFGYLARRIADFSETDYVVLRQAPIIPVVPVTGDLSPNGGLSLTMAKPCECIFKNSSFSTTHAKLFMAVDFGSKASIFLTACGIKDRPDMKDIITLLLQDPERFLKAVGSIDVYLEELRNIAAYQECPKDLTERMRTTPFLVGRLRMVQSSHGSDINESTMEGDIAIIDDINAHSLFSDLVYVSPEEETLEAFYLKLGSPRLTSLIAEECEPRSIEVLESSLSAQIRSLILERACLLLHEQGVRAKVEVEWLSLHKNFVVRCCGSLELKRFLTYGRTRATRDQCVSARVIFTNGGITLWLSRKGELDMYEVANSMCKALLNDPQPNDSSIFMAMLSTDMWALRRRGYNVNKTLRQQNVPVPWDASSFELLMQEPEFLQDMPTSEVQYWSTYWKDEGPTKEKEKLNLAPRSLDPDAAVPPGSNSDSSIMHVLDACFSANKEAQRTWLQKTLGVGDISESDCDAQCSGVSLESQAMISGYRLFILQGSPNAREVKSHQKDVIYRFIKFIVKPLRTVFNVSTTTLNIFCDESHVGVAFNKGGELFLSLHFYEKWHDQDVLSGRTKEALITWYYTLAHQIAHDSEKLHNAEHVFHNAAICKKHLPSLIALLRTAGLDAEEKGISSSLRMTKDIGIRKELRNVTRWFTGRTRGDERID